MESIGKYTKPCVPPASYTAQPSGSDTSSRRGCRRAKSAAGSAASRRFCDGACPAEVEMAMDGSVYALCALAHSRPAMAGRQSPRRREPKEKAMLMRTGVMAVSAAVAAMMFGCSPQPGATLAVVKDKIYSVTPAAMKVKSGIVTGELTEMKVTERIEEGS